MWYLGIDPGQSGGMVLLSQNSDILLTVAFGKLTEHDIVAQIESWYNEGVPIIATLERVHSMPRQGVASSFKFGDHYGFLRGVLTAVPIRYELVTPQKWQNKLKCLSKGDKNITKAAAQRLWPKIKWTHAIADAALIAEYGRRTAITGWSSKLTGPEAQDQAE